MELSKSAKRIIAKYSKKIAAEAFKSHEEGCGGRTIGQELGVKTNTADALINAGRELSEQFTEHWKKAQS